MYMCLPRYVHGHAQLDLSGVLQFSTVASFVFPMVGTMSEPQANALGSSHGKIQWANMKFAL